MIDYTKAILSINKLADFSLYNNDLTTIVWRSSFPMPSEEKIQAKIAELEAAEPLRQLRQQRDQKLSQSDWMAVSDRTMSPEQIAYRQSLRDMPANNPEVALNEAGELINITWPTEPQ